MDELHATLRYVDWLNEGFCNTFFLREMPHLMDF